MKTASISLRLLQAILTLSWWGCILLTIGAALFLVATLFSKPGSMQFDFEGYVHNLDAKVLSAATRDGQSVTIQLDEPVKAKVSLPSDGQGASKWFMAGVLGWASLGIASILFFLRQLRGIVRTVEAGNPFVPENAHRLRIIGVLILLIGILRPLAELVASLIMRSVFVTEGFQFSVHFGLEFSSVLAGLSVLALSEIFRHGTALREEHELTI